jgi:hypothetical protein
VTVLDNADWKLLAGSASAFEKTATPQPNYTAIDITAKSPSEDQH